jgi:hypothetical protein
VTQRNIEILIGRLVTDEGFRQAFLTDPQQTLRDLVERGTQLTLTEMAALITTNPMLWFDIADRVDPRLQKARLP